ncbi:hypothetical protein BDB13_5062 [Rhodococcus sp. OK302]|nr:hypothetical protein BDB13_5062 [Rhodococcus sp. OK302]
MAPSWRRLLTPTAPAARHLPLRKSLSESIRVLTISDRGTKGLGGPTRADNAVTKDNDFVSFIRNIGEPRNTTHGGGTYGFGKGIFYLLSKSGTVIIHTRCKIGNSYETRLIGCSLWKSYSVGEGMQGTRYTGRHWWGDTSDEALVEPFVGEKAEDLADKLGFTAFKGKETGTTITIIDPELDDFTPEEAVRWMADAIAWNLWPKMIYKGDGTAPDMNFSVSHNGRNVPLPDPNETPPLNLFVRAYRAIEKPDAEQIWVKSPKIYLGKIGMNKTLLKPFDASPVATECGFDTTSHHICLMRTAELVVSYYKGPATGARFSSYAGVFRTDQSVDESYAKSEPPTHDAWRWEPLDGNDRKIVKVTFTRLKEYANKQVSLESGMIDATVKAPLGAASRQFSSLVSGAQGFGGATSFVPFKNARSRQSKSPNGDRSFDQGPGKRSSKPKIHENSPNSDSETETNVSSFPQGRHRSSGRPRVVYVGEPTFEIINDIPAVTQCFRIPERVRVIVESAVGVAIPGSTGKETDPPANAPHPTTLGWSDDTGTVFHGPGSLEIDGGDAIWKVIVKPAPDTVTSIELSVNRKPIIA